MPGSPLISNQRRDYVNNKIKGLSDISGAGKPTVGNFFGGHVGDGKTDITVTEANKINMPMPLLLPKDTYLIKSPFRMYA